MVVGSVNNLYVARAVPPKLPVKQSEPQVEPTLIISQPESRHYIFRDGQWYPFTSAGTRHLIVNVENKTAEQGQIAKDANGVVASVAYIDKGRNKLAHVSRAYWCRERSNEVNLEIGASKELLLGTHLMGKYCSTWIGFENCYSAPSRITPHYGLEKYPTPKQAPFDFVAMLYIEVSLIHVRTGKTFKKFCVEVVDKGNGMLTTMTVGGV
jgi:hypothetical protein